MLDNWSQMMHEDRPCRFPHDICLKIANLPHRERTPMPSPRRRCLSVKRLVYCTRVHMEWNVSKQNQGELGVNQDLEILHAGDDYCTIKIRER
jgi:hypothetical protein